MRRVQALENILPRILESCSKIFKLILLLILYANQSIWMIYSRLVLLFAAIVSPASLDESLTSSMGRVLRQ